MSPAPHDGRSPGPGDAEDFPAIEDYAVIGDCRTAALISGEGAIEWLCLPRFDGPAYFARILDRDRGGCFSIRPEADFRTERRYLPNTNVLETTFRTDDGVLRLLDLMPVTSEEQKRRALWPEHQILRIVECVEGRVEVRMLCNPRPRYGQVMPRIEDRGALGFVYQHGSRALYLRGDLPMRMLPDRSGVVGRTTLEAGDGRCVSLTFNQGEAAVIPAFGRAAEEKLEATVEWWEGWTSRLRYEGPFRDAVVRSALTVKLLTYAPSGAVIAAPTTSLPEHIGGVRNWDYRYCWLRDASLTVRALFDLGIDAEGHAFLNWLLHATALTTPELQVVYDVHGETRIPERELDHLAGYRGSRPVRTGNAARDQLQLDVYGDVVDAAYEYVLRGGSLDRSTRRTLVELGETVCRRWQEPDEGIWEIRSEPKHHTYSKAMCWVALDRLVRLHREGRLDAPVRRFEAERTAIREAIEERGYDESLESYVSIFGEKHVDASLFLLDHYGYVDPGSARARSTCRRLHRELGDGPLVHRYVDTDDGLPGGEGAFGICSFWAVECLCRQGAVEEAVDAFEELLSYANDVGLYSEEIDPDTGAALGNFPQAFTHVGLIDAALTISKCMGRMEERRPVEEHDRKAGEPTRAREAG